MSQIERRIEAAADVIDMSFSAEHTQLEYGEFCRAVAASALEASGYEADLRDAVEAIREWLAASDGLKAVDTGDGQAIKAALARVDAAKAVARRIGGQ